MPTRPQLGAARSADTHRLKVESRERQMAGENFKAWGSQVHFSTYSQLAAYHNAQKGRMAKATGRAKDFQDPDELITKGNFVQTIIIFLTRRYLLLM